MTEPEKATSFRRLIGVLISNVVLGLALLHGEHGIAAEGTMPGVHRQAQMFADQMVTLIEANLTTYGADRVIREIGNHSGSYARGNTYAFAIDRRSNLVLAHPTMNIAGKKTLQQSQDADGRFFGAVLLEQIRLNGWGYVRVKGASVKDRSLIPKSVLCRPDRANNFILCASVDETAI